MLFWLGQFLVETWGDGLYRLLTSRVILSSIGLIAAGTLTWIALPRSYRRLPHDGGRVNSGAPELARGKPTGAGIVFIPIYLFAALLAVPWEAVHLEVLACVAAALVTGFLDDRSKNTDAEWNEYRKAALDLVICVAAAAALGQLGDMEIWLPLVKESIAVPGWVYLCGATVLLWVSINATNCTDGVDGLSGSLLVLAYFYLGTLLYAVVGHREIAAYFFAPHDPLGANWGILAFTLLGTMAAYLWFNAFPSEVLMGDAGSRPLGLMLGVLVLATGNPVLILVVAGVVLINGGTGLLKLALARFFKIWIFRNIRFPLHDHCRVNLKWSSSQVLIRFTLLQAILTPVLFVIVLKLR